MFLAGLFAAVKTDEENKWFYTVQVAACLAY
jgi:hypothetical protein